MIRSHSLTMRLVFCVLAALLPLLLPAIALAEAVDGCAGGSLAEALDRLRERGLPVVYSTSLVRPELCVDEPLRARRPLRRLDELLAVHGLAAVDGPGGRLLVVPAGEHDPAAARLGSVAGRVTAADGSPRSGILVSVPGAERSIPTGRDGDFRLDGIPEGPQRLTARLPGLAEVLETTFEAVAGDVTRVEFVVPDLAPSIDQIEVVSSLYMMREDPSTAVGFGRERIETLPHFGDDLFRAVNALPGVANDDFTAAFNVRGGDQDELLVRLDGLELFEPFHLKDFEGLFSIVDPQIVGEVELMPGAFPAEFGDRSTAVLDMRSERPKERIGQLGISFSNAWASAGGRFDDGRGSWLGSLRRGYLDLLLGLAERPEDRDDEQPDPTYWDAFSKLEVDLGPRQSISLDVLVADDSLRFDETDGNERTQVDTGWQNRYVWVEHLALPTDRLVVSTVLSAATIDHDRFALAVEEPEIFALSDRREIDVLGLRHDGSLALTDTRMLMWGAEVRSFETVFDYADEIDVEGGLDDPRFESVVDVTSFRDRMTSEHYSAYLSGRMHLGARLVVEAGGRFDRQTLLDDDQLSPRLNLVLDLGRGGRWRLGWGHFFQSQRPHELAVQYGETAFEPAQRAEHASLGWEGSLGARTSLRLETYRREVENPQTRYETLFDPFQPIPQAARDLVRIAPESTLAQGVEATLSSRWGDRGDWWLTYVRSSVEDRIGGRDVPRWYDQPDALTAGVSYRKGLRWVLTGVARYHSGWPTTRVDATAIRVDDGFELEHEIGPFYAERLDDYLSFDLRFTRTAPVRHGELTLFVDVQNLLDRDNPRGLAIDAYRIRRRDDSFDVRFERRYWLGFLPSFGISWRF